MKTRGAWRPTEDPRFLLRPWLYLALPLPPLTPRPSLRGGRGGLGGLAGGTTGAAPAFQSSAYCCPPPEPLASSSASCMSRSWPSAAAFIRAVAARRWSLRRRVGTSGLEVSNSGLWSCSFKEPTTTGDIYRPLPTPVQQGAASWERSAAMRESPHTVTGSPAQKPRTRLSLSRSSQTRRCRLVPAAVVGRSSSADDLQDRLVSSRGAGARRLRDCTG